jgi:poly(3-hydroxybutyrate) depolymerase
MSHGAYALTRLGVALVAGASVSMTPHAQTAAPASQNGVVVRETAPERFSQSLAFRTDRLIADQTHGLMGWLAQSEPAPYRSGAALRLKVALHTAGAEARLVKDLSTTFIFGGNLATHPFPVNIDLRGAPDGDYQYFAELWDSATLIRSFRVPVKLVAGLDARQADVERRLTRITGHDSAKASIRYPFDLARVINLGKRVFGSGTGNPEFGLNQAGEPTLYDFAAGMTRSVDLLAALEAGTDPVWRARGEMVRHYYMPEADEILPYRVFVPSTWDGKAALPLVFILHGNSRDQDFYFYRDGRIIPRTAEQHGFMLVGPLGYAPNGGYNYVPYGRAAGPRGVAAAVAAPQVFGPQPPAPAGRRGGRAAGGYGGVNGSVTPALVRSEWSELDTMHVFDLIRQEYPIDPKRTFLFGYSAGGQGAHYLGPKYIDNWAAIAIGGSNATAGEGYPFARLRGTPMLIFCGTDDAPNLVRSRDMVTALRQNGVPAVLKEYAGATHDSAPSAATPDVFTFFAANGRK